MRGWPTRSRPPWHASMGEDVFPAGIPVLSRSGAIRGVTLGRGAPCPSRSCSGRLMCVEWESGQITHPCTAGWSLVEVGGVRWIRLTGGGEITGRVINRKDPLPREEWPRLVDRSGVDWDAVYEAVGLCREGLDEVGPVVLPLFP